MDSNDLTITNLAQQFETSKEIMAEFCDRFSPKKTVWGSFYEKSDTMLFVHIPKTAGVSVGKSLQACFDKFYGIQWDNVGPSFRNATRQAAYNQSRGGGRQVIMGHYGWPEIQIWRNHEMPIKCGTIFRDPVARFVSNFNYNSSDAHPGRDAFVKRFPTIESYLKNAELDVQLTQAVGFVASFEDALRKFIKYYTFLGVTEKLTDSLRHLSQSHQLRDIQEHRENVGTNKAAALSDAVVSLIRQRSHNDLKLHQLLMKLYGG
ncbi:sulfotransferase family 2 domain-containing protein [Paracoccus actinidiae]|uniref:sulfotransferase family 2 domain-containing protein n=1 Tax=Paracoccus actinidiae TaxID=3064531 RepID=UPI0027D2BB05|nr:sulfotransferase family 2 domain-containing protein [Paracoccus sp. M09]